jgi:hypothetical protein
VAAIVFPASHLRRTERNETKMFELRDFFCLGRAVSNCERLRWVNTLMRNDHMAME